MKKFEDYIFTAIGLLPSLVALIKFLPTWLYPFPKYAEFWAVLAFIISIISFAFTLIWWSRRLKKNNNKYKSKFTIISLFFFIACIICGIIYYIILEYFSRPGALITFIQGFVWIAMFCCLTIGLVILIKILILINRRKPMS